MGSITRTITKIREYSTDPFNLLDVKIFAITCAAVVVKQTWVQVPRSGQFCSSGNVLTGNEAMMIFPIRGDEGLQGDIWFA